MADPRTLTFQIDPDLREKLEAESERTELSVSELIRLRLRASYALGERAKIPRARMEVHYTPGIAPAEPGDLAVVVFDSEDTKGKKRRVTKQMKGHS